MQSEQTGLDDAVRQQVADLLSRLRTGGHASFSALRTLFNETLNYDYANESLSLDASLNNLPVEQPLLVATGAEGQFHVIYIRFTHNALSPGDERKIVTKLLRNHLYALFIFSNYAQTTWHFINVKNEPEHEKRRVFRRITVAREDRLRTAIERISMLNLKRLETSQLLIMPLDIQRIHDEAFDVEAVTKRFFDEYSIIFRILQKDLLNQTGDPTWAHDYALQFLNRCMFLYFIQRKHWLGENTEFLNYFWQSYLKTAHEPNAFVKDWLMVLFFQAFNNNYNGRYRHFPDDIQAILSQAPYLNGGLFTENALDKEKSGEFVISDERFYQVLHFLEQYNFTITEDSPLDQEVAVDPEMIGKVYESLVNVSEDLDERGDAGIFYTPRVEIDLMCRLSLAEYLVNHLGAHKTRKRGLSVKCACAIDGLSTCR